jgi:hypothetical protein
MAKRLTKTQVAALKRAMKRRGAKLPRTGRCKPVGGGYPTPGKMAAAVVCHRRQGNKHVYEITQTRGRSH